MLDDEGIPWKGLVIGFSVSIYLLEEYLDLRQYKVLGRKSPPAALENVIDKETFKKSQAYSKAKMKFSFVAKAYGMVQNLVILKYDILPWLWNIVGAWQTRYLSERFGGQIVHSLLFFGGFSLPTTLLNLPLSLYSTFVLEEKFGFNKQTLRLFVTDFIKEQLLIHVIGGPLLAAFLKIIDYFGSDFYYYLWTFFLVFQIVMITVFPILIQPLFNKFEPLPSGKLKEDIEGLARKLKFPLKKLLVIDGSKRSAHSNAYFYGLPWSKRIVIYDTLIEKSENDEVVAVLAHELGHWAKSHTTQGLCIGQVHLFAIFALFSAFVNNSSMYKSFGFGTLKPALIGFVIFNDVFQPIDSILSLLMHILSRKNEYEADAFAKDLGYERELGQALIKLQVQNLSSMDADKLYSAYHYSHPILSERLEALGYKGGKTE